VRGAPKSESCPRKRSADDGAGATLLFRAHVGSLCGVVFYFVSDMASAAAAAAASAAMSPASWVPGWADMATGFAFVEGELPLSRRTWARGAACLYLALLYYFGTEGRKGSGERDKKKRVGGLRLAFALHNFLLSGVSLVLFVLLARNIGARFFGYLSGAGGARGGGGGGLLDSAHRLVCERGMLVGNGEAQLIYYGNYLLKFYELLDTAFLVALGKPVAFLHWYHHSATLLLTSVQQIEGSAVQWTPILLNLGVHVLMYSYYALAALGVRCWWKQSLTTLQITQFVVDVSVITYCSVLMFLKGGDSDFGGCQGTRAGAINGCLILYSYLVLFVKLYRDLYGAGKPLPRGKTPARKSARLSSGAMAVDKNS